MELIMNLVQLNSNAKIPFVLSSCRSNTVPCESGPRISRFQSRTA